MPDKCMCAYTLMCSPVRSPMRCSRHGSTKQIDQNGPSTSKGLITAGRVDSGYARHVAYLMATFSMLRPRLQSKLQETTNAGTWTTARHVGRFTRRISRGERQSRASFRSSLMLQTSPSTISPGGLAGQVHRRCGQAPPTPQASPVASTIHR